MEANRPVVLSIAGFDPCAGAGILADIKTFEQHKVYGVGINTARTLQTENDFISIRWEDENSILQSLETMLSQYNVKALKIGIIENISVLNSIISYVHQKDTTIKIVVDTVIKSSSGFNFWNEQMQEASLIEILSKIFLITPNYNEVLQLMPSSNAKESAKKLSAYCNVLLKGGHNKEELGIDYLYTQNDIERLEGNNDEMYAKHGSGCVLSAAITANLALSVDLLTSCSKAKKYIEQFLSSNKTLLGYHHV
ncbi:MAG: hydroxymethylpyrimidine/phosphomethylpyrimidine kinase [Ferruginibacter sp.]|uniref:hydroxymethylpyrimidine/phosphomethylpyrimidine kinase n=1 Tax=Ferruginibacter sp. TaxID=1940288 RepID=UPI0026590B70|nr:hydroxymethylpyrimidine/phosphomethylpyrimidine kinase [Ferruginibacter sp.]MDB5280659.1 hydroxymethylpyrimidine/phosphomethylpyrimidine kinase [Ferruginibacter sp.]